MHRMSAIIHLQRCFRVSVFFRLLRVLCLSVSVFLCEYTCSNLYVIELRFSYVEMENDDRSGKIDITGCESSKIKHICLSIYLSLSLSMPPQKVCQSNL